MRLISNIPVIFLSSKEEEIDEVLALKMGADDYIRKPFSQRLLLERVKVLLRRATLKDSCGSKASIANVLDRGIPVPRRWENRSR